MLEVMTVKIPLHPNKTQLKEFSNLSYCYHRLGNLAVELLREFKYDMKETGLRNSLNSMLDSLPKCSLGFITTVVAKEKVLAFRKHGKVNFHKYNKNNKRFPVRCDANIPRVSRIYSDDLENIKIPSVSSKVKISYKWRHNLIKKKGIEYLDSILNCKKQTARVTYDGKYWYLVFSTYYEPETVDLKVKAVGVDVGIEKLAVTSEGDFEYGINNSKEVRRLEIKEKKLQKIVARKYRTYNKGTSSFKKSKNILKLEKKIFLVCRRLRNLRENELHKISKKLVDLHYKVIAFENLNIRGMLRNKYLAPSIQKQGWYKLAQFTKYKALSKGESFIQVNRWYSSSKKCSQCGAINRNLKLSDRVFKCNECGLEIDRDFNASLNIRDEGFRLVLG